MSLPSIVVVGRLAERYKGHDVLLRALDLVRDQVPEAELHVVGAGPLRPELEALARRLGVDSAITFHGEVSDARRDEILGGATVFAMPSRVEHGEREKVSGSSIPRPERTAWRLLRATREERSMLWWISKRGYSSTRPTRRRSRER